MSEHTATIAWQRNGVAFIDNRYSRAHQWTFDGGAVIAAAASPAVVLPRYTDPAAVDPEEAFVASIASCHMLWFLALAAQQGWCVDSYADAASGTLGETAPGRLAFSAIVLRPRVSYTGQLLPSPAAEAQLHDAAHAKCFIANSVNCPIRIETPTA